MPRQEYSLPEDVWLHVFTFLSVAEKHRVRATCRHFRDVVDKYARLWRGFTVVLSRLSRYDRGFWATLGRRDVRSVVLRGGGGDGGAGGERKHLRRLLDALPAVTAVAVAGWPEPRLDSLARFSGLSALALHGSRCPLDLLPALRLLAPRLTRLSVCHVKLRSPAAHFVAAVAQMRRLTRLLYHHDGAERVPLRAFREMLGALPRLQHLSWEMVSYRSLPDDFFTPPAAAPAVQQELEGCQTLPLSSLELLNYDTEVSEEALVSLSGLQRLSVFHLYSVPGPRCHLQTWLLALHKLTHLSVHGGHRLGAYANCVSESVVGLTLCVDLTLEDLEVLGRRLPHLQHLHLEPWGTTGYVGLVPQLFPQLRTLKIRHHNVSERDFLGLALLDKLHHLEVLDWYCSPRRPDEDHAPSSPRLAQLIGQLRHLTNNRVNITSKSHQDPLLCQCLS